MLVKEHKRKAFSSVCTFILWLYALYGITQPRYKRNENARPIKIHASISDCEALGKAAGAFCSLSFALVCTRLVLFRRLRLCDLKLLLRYHQLNLIPHYFHPPTVSKFTLANGIVAFAKENGNLRTRTYTLLILLIYNLILSAHRVKV